MVKLYTPKGTNVPMLDGICEGIELYNYNSLLHPVLIKCAAHYNARLEYSECLECLCQSAELLEGKLRDKN